MLGCFERGLFPGVSRAVRALLPDIAVPPRQGCCGALHAHNGESEKGRDLARELGEQLPGTIVTTAGGCAAHLAGVLGRDRVHELSEHLARTGATPVGEVRVDGRRARVAIQDSCHLRNGLRVFAEPRAAISAVADLVPVPARTPAAAPPAPTRCCARATAGASSRPSSTRTRRPGSTSS
jgi:glycolate oxidase iron-sulfur subunit